MEKEVLIPQLLVRQNPLNPLVAFFCKLRVEARQAEDF